MAKNKINTAWIVLGAIALIILLLVGWVVGSYNSLVTLDNTANNQWAQIETQYQRRADLIPNLVNTVKGVKDFEASTYLAIANARSQWQAATTTDQKMAAAQGMDTALGRLIAVAENYPDLKANQNFLALQDELAGTENRIAVARMNYNNAVTAYNIAIKKIPMNFIAGIFGFTQKPYFEAEAGADQPPVVTF